MGPLGRGDAEVNPVNTIAGVWHCWRVVGSGHVGRVKELLGCLGIDLDLRDGDGRSLLCLAAETGC